jgi:GH15 family glucan-1,4-alpha-glucosidase
VAPFPPLALRDYAVLADGERGAVISPQGEIVWMCAPTWHSPAVFAGLLGGEGHMSVSPVATHVWGGHYEPGTLIWRSRWITRDGIVMCREALAFPGDPHRTVLLRRVLGPDHDARVRLLVDPRADYGRTSATWRRSAPGVWTGRTGDLRLRLSGLRGRPRRSRQPAPALCWDLQLSAGQHLDIVLEISDQDLPAEVPDATEVWRATETAWHEIGRDLDVGDRTAAARHSLAVLRGLTSSSGGMVAAATTSLPERAQAGRNYDYRYAWIRDLCYAAQAAAAAGTPDLLDMAVQFLTARMCEHGDRLAPAYTVHGDRVPDQHPLHLPGYPGGFDRAGNWVNRQFQLDAFGEVLLTFAAANAADRLDDDGHRAAELAVKAITARWHEPDAGIWELNDQHWTHSRLTCVAGLRAWGNVSTAPGDLVALADRILADTSRHALHPSGRWQRSREDVGLDAALLIPPLRGAPPADDPRTQATLGGVLAELTEDGHAYRFRHDKRPLHEAEGSFTLCSFFVAEALAQQGRTIEAVRWFERAEGTWGPPEVFAEEYDVVEHQLRGNLPQAFVHAVHLEAAVRLAPEAIGP